MSRRQELLVGQWAALQCSSCPLSRGAAHYPDDNVTVLVAVGHTGQGPPAQPCAKEQLSNVSRSMKSRSSRSAGWACSPSSPRPRGGGEQEECVLRVPALLGRIASQACPGTRAMGSVRLQPCRAHRPPAPPVWTVVLNRDAQGGTGLSPSLRTAVLRPFAVIRLRGRPVATRCLTANPVPAVPTQL